MGATKQLHLETFQEKFNYLKSLPYRDLVAIWQDHDHELNALADLLLNEYPY